jgi:hypothetical protein
MPHNNVLFRLTKAVNVFVSSSSLLALTLFLQALRECSQQHIGSDPCEDSHGGCETYATLLINLVTERVGVTLTLFSRIRWVMGSNF